jgi:hypothetical protein
MSNEPDLDRLIDKAARQMAGGEPSDALARAVMQRVDGRAIRFAHRWLLWGGVATALAGLLITVSDRPAPLVEAPPRAFGSGLRAQNSRSNARGAGLEVQNPRLKAQGSGLRRQSSLTRFTENRAAIDRDETEKIEDPITLESIESAPLEVEGLQVTTLTTIAPIEIPPIEIAPISTSND